MRESPKTERMHLGDAYEEWLKNQRLQPGKAKGLKKAPDDMYEAWILRQLQKRSGRARPAAS
jgi:hypothetical protein